MIGEFLPAIPGQRFVEFVREFTRLLEQGVDHGVQRIPHVRFGSNFVVPGVRRECPISLKADIHFAMLERPGIAINGPSGA